MRPRDLLRFRAAIATRLSPAVVLVLLLSAAAAVRFTLLALEWPASNSDEGTFGLMAIHIAEGRHFPDFMYGQAYMGSAESYLAAAVFWLSGPSLVALRVPMVLMYLVFLLVMYVLARRLYGSGVALVSVGLLTLGSRELYGHQLVTQGAIPETLLAGSILLLLSHRLLETAGGGNSARRRWMLAGWGLAVTLGLWSTLLVAPFVLTSGVLLWLARRRHRGSAPRGGGWAMAGGLLVGALPWLAHDLPRPFAETSVAALIELYTHGGTGLNGARSAGLVSQVTNTVTTSLAYVTGGSAVAHPHSPPAWPFGFSGSWRPPTDDAITTGWGAFLILLWTAGVIGVLRALRRRGAALPDAVADGSAGTRRRHRSQLYGRFAMLISAGLTTAAFAASPTPGVAPANNVRYLIGVLVATPAVVAPLWALRPAGPRFARVVRLGALGLVAVTLALGTVQAFRDASRGPGEAASRELIRALQHNGINRIYSGYLDCGRLLFISREQLVCAVLFEGPGDSLRTGFDRHLPYRATVHADPRAAYVFRSGDPRNGILARSACRWESRWHLLGYEVWQPAERCGMST